MTERAPEHPPVMPIRCKIWRIPRAGLDEREAGGAALLSQPPRPLWSCSGGKAATVAKSPCAAGQAALARGALPGTPLSVSHPVLLFLLYSLWLQI